MATKKQIATLRRVAKDVPGVLRQLLHGERRKDTGGRRQHLTLLPLYETSKRSNKLSKLRMLLQKLERFTNRKEQTS